MIGGINLNNFAVDQNGRVTLSGGASGIDFNSAIDNIIAARRIPADRLEANIETNTDKIAAFNDLRSLLNVMRDRLDALRGKVTVGGAGNIFKAKQVFASTSRSDAVAPAAAGNLVGVTVTNAADLGTHTIEILQIAQAHKVSGGAATSTTIDLGAAFGGVANSISGSFEINGRRIEVQPSDTLIALADRINTANTGANATKVTASIVSTGAFQHFLVLTADDTGTPIEITDSTKESLLVADKTARLDSYTSVTGTGNTFEIQDAAGNPIGVVTYDDADTLETLAVKVSLIAGITATVTDVGTQARLDISADNGTSIKLANDTNNVVADLVLNKDILNDIGLSSDLGTTFTTELTVARNALLKADGLKDTGAFQSSGLATATTLFNVAGTLNIATPNAGLQPIVVDDLTDTPTTLRNKINADVDLTAAGITASLVTDSAGLVHLEIRRSDLTVEDNAKVLAARPALSGDALGIVDTLVFKNDSGATIDTIPILITDSLDSIAAKIGASLALQNAGVSASAVAAGSAFKLQLTYDTTLTVTSPGTADVDLGLARPDLVIKRDSNNVTDLFAGISLSLFQSEVGTTIKLDIDRNLVDLRQAVVDFVDAYNEVRSFINLQQQSDSSTGAAGADSGPLFGSSVLGNIDSSLTELLGQGAAGLASGSAFQVLAQIGVNFVDNNSIADPLLADTLEIDDTVLDEALVNDPESVRRLFAFDFTASDPRVGLISFSANTKPKGVGYTLAVVHDGTSITSATIDGVPGSVTINGSVLTATGETGANGLTLIYNGTTSATGIQLDISNGIGSKLFFELDRVLDSQTGPVQSEVDTLTDQSDFAQVRIDELLARLERQREDLLGRFIRMESALSSINSILNAIEQQFTALQPRNN